MNELTNKQQLNAAAAAAKNDIKKMSIMYYVNQLNKLAKKNEFVDKVNIRELGVMLKEHTGEKDLFTARCFTKDTKNRPCYVVKAKKCPKYGFDLVNVSENGWEYLRPVQMSLIGLITAYRAILAPVAAAADKAAAAARKAERQTANKAAAAARKAVREQQKQAISDYQNGRIDINEFARIMSIAA